MEVESAEMKDASHGRMKQVKMGSLMEWCGVVWCGIQGWIKI